MWRTIRLHGTTDVKVMKVVRGAMPFEEFRTALDSALKP